MELGKERMIQGRQDLPQREAGLQLLPLTLPLFGSCQLIGRQHLFMPSVLLGSCTLSLGTAALGILTTVAVMTPETGNWVSSDIGGG